MLAAVPVLGERRIDGLEVEEAPLRSRVGVHRSSFWSPYGDREMIGGH